MFSSLFVAFLALIVSLLILVKGADMFLESASKIAKHFGMSEFVVGLTLVSIGTSLPELANAITASITKEPGIIMGNIIGSNIANIGLVLAITLIITTITIKQYEYEKIFITLLAVLMFSLFASDLQISRYEALIMIALFFVYFRGIFKIKHKHKNQKKFFSSLLELRGLLSFSKLRELNQARNNSEHGKLPKKFMKEALFYESIREFIILIIGIALIILGSRYTIFSAVDISVFLNVQQSVIAAFIVAIGTTLPELFVNLTGIKKGYKDLVLGNLLGSIVFNSLIIIGIASLINPIKVNIITLRFLIPSMLVFCFLLFVFFKKSQELRRREGILLLFLYILYIAVLLLTSIHVIS